MKYNQLVPVVPNWFVWSVATARSGDDADKYWSCGHELARHADEYVEEDDADDILQGELEEIWQTQEECTLRASLEAWLRKRFPCFLGLIPPVGIASFLDGVIDCVEDEVM